MGMFSYYLGDMDIPEADRPEYARQALAMLRAGGMMLIDKVRLYGKTIHLFFPPELNDKGEVRDHYNYLDNENWEDWGLNAEKGVFGSNKIGGKCFCRTILAVKILSCLWSKTYDAVTLDGHLVEEWLYLGWINGVLGTSYTNWRATQVWTLAKLLHKEKWCSQYNDDLIDLIGYIPVECTDIRQGVDYMAACHLEEFLQEAEIKSEPISGLFEKEHLSPGSLYGALMTALADYHKGGGTLEEAKKCLTVTVNERRSVTREQKNGSLIVAAGLVSPVGAVAMTAKEFGVEFWELWDEIGDRIPDIAPMKPPAPEPCPPLPPESTQEALDLDPDDMAYYWTPEAPLQFSDGMNAWMKELRTELEGITGTIPVREFLPTLVKNIADANGTFFRDAFYELIRRQEEVIVQRAVVLLGRMGERCDKDIRNYVAILGNPLLRERVLGF